MAQRTAEEIEQLVNDYRRRGEVTRQAFCESRGISLGMLDYYLRRYGKSTIAPSARMVKVKVEPEGRAETPDGFTVVLRNGRRIESQWRFGDAELTRLIRIVEAG